MKKCFSVALAAVVFLPMVTGCTHMRRTWDHTKWHLNGAYQDLVSIHETIDRHFFDLDERNPDRY